MVKPVTNNLISLQSIYSICLEGDIIANKNLYYDKEYMISELNRFHEETGKIPNTSNISAKFMDYPGAPMFERLFGSFNAALKEAGFIREQNSMDKGKKAERIVKNSWLLLEDTSLEDWRAPYDLICSKGYKVDVKGSKLNIKYKHDSKTKWWNNPTCFWTFNTKKKTVTDYYICLGFDNKFEKLKHVWIFKNDAKLKSKHSIRISEKMIANFKKNEWDAKKCNLDLTFDSFMY